MKEVLGSRDSFLFVRPAVMCPGVARPLTRMSRQRESERERERERTPIFPASKQARESESCTRSRSPHSNVSVLPPWLLLGIAFRSKASGFCGNGKNLPTKASGVSGLAHDASHWRLEQHVPACFASRLTGGSDGAAVAFVWGLASA